MERARLSRKSIRQLAFQTLFMQTFSPDVPIDVLLSEVLTEQYQEELSPQLSFDDTDLRYLKTLVETTLTNETQIDALIEKYSKNWAFNRILRSDLTILRQAIGEMKFMPTDDDLEIAPPIVVVNEAVDLAKEFSEDKSPSFINGILSNILD
ncbi:MAG: transcription antitermination factor NusB [Bavariicoccus seileri]|uniref:transcription antitermination factor NusB n=1 Tax=Bavariicoccus seileri TaxID=549685 RepID=UPI003F90D0A7